MVQSDYSYTELLWIFAHSFIVGFMYSADTEVLQECIKLTT